MKSKEKKREKMKPEKGDGINKRFERKIRNSAFARLLTLIGMMDSWLENLFSGFRNKEMSERGKGKRGLWRKTKLAVAKEIEQSVFFRFVNLFFDALLRLPVRVYGSVLFASSIGMAVVASVKNYIGGGTLLPVKTLIVYLCAAVASIFLLAVSKEKSLGTAFLESRIFSYILIDLFGIRKQSLETKRTAEVHYLWVLVFSLMLSLATVFVPPAVPIFVFVWLLFARLAFYSPEAGFIAILVFFPLIPGFELMLMMILVLTSYVVKIFRSQRTFRPTFFGFVMLLYAVLALFGTLMTPVTGEGLPFGQCFTVLSAFFLAHKLFERREWLRRAMSAIVFGAVIAGLWIAVFAGLWLLTDQEGLAVYRTVFPFISGNKFPGGMAGDESAAIYAAAAISLLTARYLKEKKLIHRLFAVIGGVALAAGAILSQRPAAWFALAAALLVLLMINRNFAVIPTTVAVTSVAIVYAAVLPKWITDYVSGYSKHFVAEAGIVGSQFASGVSRFFGAGEAAVDGHGNFFSHIVTAQGVIGLLFFLFVVIGAFGYSYYCCVRNADCSRQIKQFLFGSCSSVAALLTAGVFYDLWIDPKLPFMLFMLLGLIFAGGRVLLRESEQLVLVSDTDRDYYFIPVVSSSKNAEKEKNNDRANETAADDPGDKGPSETFSGDAPPAEDSGEASRQNSGDQASVSREWDKEGGLTGETDDR